MSGAKIEVSATGSGAIVLVCWANAVEVAVQQRAIRVKRDMDFPDGKGCRKIAPGSDDSPAECFGRAVVTFGWGVGY